MGCTRVMRRMRVDAYKNSVRPVLVSLNLGTGVATRPLRLTTDAAVGPKKTVSQQPHRSPRCHLPQRNLRNFGTYSSRNGTLTSYIDVVIGRNRARAPWRFKNRLVTGTTSEAGARRPHGCNFIIVHKKKFYVDLGLRLFSLSLSRSHARLKRACE